MSACLINIIRGIPIIVLLFYLYFVMPDFGITLTALQAAILGLGIAYSAYQAENFRAGIEAIDKGQIEAAQTIGMGWWLTMRRVILPQAVRIVLPPYGNVMIMLLKDSSQASTITVAELALQGKLIASSTFKNTSVFTLVALMYLTMSIPLILLVRHFEKKASPPMIELRNVHKSFGKVEVLKGITASVAKSEVVCIIGPSGSGKSTILRCINGLESYDSRRHPGRGRAGRARRASIVAIRTQVSMVFQRFNLFPHRTALENVVEGPIYVKHEPRARRSSAAVRCWRRWVLPTRPTPIRRSFRAASSSGSRLRGHSRCSPTRSCSTSRPRRSIPNWSATCLSVMRKLADDGMTMVVVTHEMGFAREVADRVLFIDGGVIVEQGAAKSLLNQPQHARTQDFLRRVLHPL